MDILIGVASSPELMAGGFGRISATGQVTSAGRIRGSTRHVLERVGGEWSTVTVPATLPGEVGRGIVAPVRTPSMKTIGRSASLESSTARSHR